MSIDAVRFEKGELVRIEGRYNDKTVTDELIEMLQGDLTDFSDELDKMIKNDMTKEQRMEIFHAIIERLEKEGVLKRIPYSFLGVSLGRGDEVEIYD
jgi:hypothetical protein